MTHPQPNHTEDLPPVADLPAGARVWFQLGTGTVVVGELLADSPYDHFVACAPGDRVARVEIDHVGVGMDWPTHVAPPHVQPEAVKENGWLFRDSYTIDADEQVYLVSDETLVSVRSW